MCCCEHITPFIYRATTFINYCPVTTHLIFNAPTQGGLKIITKTNYFNNINKHFVIFMRPKIRQNLILSTRNVYAETLKGLCCW